MAPKVKSYKFINPNLIKVMKNPSGGIRSSMVKTKGLKLQTVSAKKGGKSQLDTETFTKGSRKTLLGLNRIGASVYSLGKVFENLRDANKAELGLQKLQDNFERKKKQFKKDQASEQATESYSKKDIEKAGDGKDVKKKAKKELTWLERLLGPFKGIAEFAIKTILVQGVLRWVSDPKNGERIGKIVGALQTYFGFVFGIAQTSIGLFMDGLSGIFGDGSKQGLARFGEVLGGLGTLLLGIVGLKALGYMLNPFALIIDIVGLSTKLINQQNKADARAAADSARDAVDTVGDATDAAKGKSIRDRVKDLRKGLGDKVKAARSGITDNLKAARSGFTRFTNFLGTGKDNILKSVRSTAGTVGGNIKKTALAQLDTLAAGTKSVISNAQLLGQAFLDQGKKIWGQAGNFINASKDKIAKIGKLASDPKALREMVTQMVKGKVEGAIKSNDLVKRLYEAVKNPKAFAQLIKDALKSKQALKTLDYLKQVQKGAKIGGIDKVIAVITALLEYGVGGTPFVNAFLGAMGGLLGYAGGFALGAPFGGLPGFIAGAAGGMAGEFIGRQLARLLARSTPLGTIKDPVMNDGRMLAGDPDNPPEGTDDADKDPKMATGGIVERPTRAVIGERGPEAVVPLSQLGQGEGGQVPDGKAEIASAVGGALKAMGPVGGMVRKAIAPELAKLSTDVGAVADAQPGESFGTVSSNVKGTGGKEDEGDSSNVEKFIGKTGDPNPKTLRGQLALLRETFVGISKKKIKGGSGGRSGGGGDDGGSIDTSGIEAATGSVTDKGAAIAKKFMSNLGLTKEAAAAIAGNFAHESGGFIPGIREGGPYGRNSKPWPKGTVGKGYGWAQWTNSAPGDRYDKFIDSYGGDYNKTPTNEDNLKFAIKEMKTVEKLPESFKKSTDVAGSAVWFRANWERAGVHHDEPRISYAKGILEKMAKGGELNGSQIFQKSMSAIEDRKKQMGKIRQSVGRAAGGVIKVEGDGSGWAGTLTMYKDGSKFGKSYKARSGQERMKGTSQKDRHHKKMSPHPDGTYSLLGGEYHGYIMPGLGDWSVYIGNASGSLGSRSGLMFHNDIGNNGTAGCIGIDVGGSAGSAADKEFWEKYKELNPKKMVINLLGKGAGKVDDLDTDDSSDSSSDSEQEDPKETLQSVTAKIAEAIAKLAGGPPQVSNVKETTKEVKATDTKAPPPAASAPPAKVSPTAEASSSGSAMSASSSSVAAAKESKKNKSGVVPVPVPVATTSINNGGSAAPPTVVRARQPITTGI